MYDGDCYGCDVNRAMEQIKMDGRSYKEQIAMNPSENFIEIEPITGVMTHMKRSYTVVLNFVCYENS